MHFNKSLRITVVALVVITLSILALSYSKPSEYVVSKSERLYTSDSTAYLYITHLELQQKWNSFFPKSKIDVKEGDGQKVGEVWSWNSASGYAHKFKFTKLIENRLVEATYSTTIDGEETIYFMKWKIHKKGTQCEVEWSTSGNLGFPIERFMYKRIKFILSKEMSNSLAELAYIHEQKLIKQ